MGQIDPAELSQWFESYGAPLVLYARQWLRAGQAEDVVQDVFVRLITQPRPRISVRGWLFQSVRNAAISQLRGRRRRQKHQQRLAADLPRWFEARPDELVDAEAVQAALASLPPSQREIVVLRIWAGMTLQAAAELTGQPISTIFSRYRAALAAIRQRMETPCKKRD